jgi:hypothetical protein
MSEIEPFDRPDEDRDLVTDSLLWFGFLGGAFAWVIHLLSAYAIAEFGCISPFHQSELWGFSGIAWLIGAVSVVTLVVAFAAFFVARRSKLRFAGAIEARRLEAGDARVFLARSGVITSALFILIIVVESIPILFYLRGC